MNYCHSYIISIFACLLPISAIAQIEPDIIRPSVNAEQFSVAVKADAALSNGQLSLNIPLMELKGRGYDLPISLIFYNGDVTFCSEASSIGLGWALMAGGVITKTIKGKDDLTNRTDNSHFTNGNYIVDRFNDWRNHSVFVEDIQLDPMPDEYTYSLPGHSGTIDITVNGSTINRKLYPDESYKIETSGKGYCITADDGTKFYFEDAECRTVIDANNESTSWFLTKIVTTKGGVFTFNYADEEYVDLSTEENERYFEKFCTKRITSIVSDFGSVVFSSVNRDDRGGIGNRSITKGMESKRINKIEMRDENGVFVKGYELDNSGSFTYSFAPDDSYWLNYRHKLSSITQYDAEGNRLPPYVFSYSYKFSNSRLASLTPNTNSDGDYLPRNSWTSYVGPQAYVDLQANGDPSCYMAYPNTPYTYLVGITIKTENFASTAGDFFCLASVNYPNGAIEEFTYENHNYSKVNWTKASSFRADKIHGKRIASKVRYGTELTQQTEYVYKLHDSNYNATGPSSGVMTNPSIHCATYYTPGSDNGQLKYVASRVTSGKAFNSFMGSPVCYTEVEEIEKDVYDNILNRTIHYFEPKRVSPPVNYIFLYYHNGGSSLAPNLVEIGNAIYGTKTGYTGNMSYCNNDNMTYIAYPVGEFTSVSTIGDQPRKEVLIGKDGKVRSVRKYSYFVEENFSKFGYKVISENFYIPPSPNIDHTVSWISRSEYRPQRFRLSSINTTSYYYNGNTCDSVCEEYHVTYSKGRVQYTSYTRSNEKKSTNYYFPGDILNIVGNNSSPALEAVNGLIDRNIIAAPIKTVIKRNNIVIGGECKDYQMHSGAPLLKSIYKMKYSKKNINIAPAINGNEINYDAELYKEGEILTYDEYHNPEHIRIKDCQDRIYVWGYGGRFPVAVIDNMSYASFNADTTLKTLLSGLSAFRKIETEEECMSLRNANNAIRNRLPETAHITTYTYDPYFGVTSEIDDSNLGMIYTYDNFGRLSAKYDAYYKKIEEYKYNLHLQ